MTIRIEGSEGALRENFASPRPLRTIGVHPALTLATQIRPQMRATGEILRRATQAAREAKLPV